jgi:hypothetical protein
MDASAQEQPREVVDALKKSGRWQEGEAKNAGSNTK